VAAGDFSSAERYVIDEAIRRAETLCRFEFSVFVGSASGEPRAFATQLHNSLVAPSRSILIMVDPAAHALEIVTGGTVRRNVKDSEVDLVALEMGSRFAEDDLVGGLKRGIEMLAEHAKAPQTLHSEPQA
jgi:uncharacterized membrane protein YgcG